MSSANMIAFVYSRQVDHLYELRIEVVLKPNLVVYPIVMHRGSDEWPSTWHNVFDLLIGMSTLIQDKADPWMPINV